MCSENFVQCTQHSYLVERSFVRLLPWDRQTDLLESNTMHCKMQFQDFLAQPRGRAVSFLDDGMGVFQDTLHKYHFFQLRFQRYLVARIILPCKKLENSCILLLVESRL